MTGKLLLKGTTSRTSDAIAEAIESIGGSLDSYGGNNSFGVNAEVLSPDFAIGLDLVLDVLLNPTFPEDAFAREREVQLAAVRAQRDQLLQSAVKTMRGNLFGPQGYGLDPIGSEKSLEQMTARDLKSFHAEFVAPSNCVLAIYGDVKAELVRSALERAVSQWKGKNLIPALAQPALPFKRQNRTVERKDKKQAVLVIGFPGTSMDTEDRYPLELIQEACSDLGSRLFLRVREKLGLAYYVGAQNFVGIAPGYFAFYAGTAPEKVEQVEREIMHEAELLRTEGLTEDELRRAKAKLIGQRKIARQDLGSLALGQALDELYGFGYDFGDRQDAKLEAVTLDQVRRVAENYLRSELSVVSIIAPE
jgi:zinc protease